MSSVRYNAAMVRRASAHRKAGWTYEQIRDLIAKETGNRPALNTVRSWAAPGAGDVLRERDRRAKARRRLAVPVQLRLSRERQFALLAEFRAAGVPVPSCVKVARVLWGETLSEDQVRYRLGSET